MRYQPLISKSSRGVIVTFSDDSGNYNRVACESEEHAQSVAAAVLVHKADWRQGIEASECE